MMLWSITNYGSPSLSLFPAFEQRFTFSSQVKVTSLFYKDTLNT